MTDADIMKALVCCPKAQCSECPYDINCIARITSDALDLINRQKADNERLKKLLAEEEAKYKECAKRFYKEAIKEFAEMIKDRYPNKYVVWGGGAYGITFENFIDNLVKEMVGDTE